MKASVLFLSFDSRGKTESGRNVPLERKFQQPGSLGAGRKTDPAVGRHPEFHIESETARNFQLLRAVSEIAHLPNPMSAPVPQHVSFL